MPLQSTRRPFRAPTFRAFGIAIAVLVACAFPTGAAAAIGDDTDDARWQGMNGTILTSVTAANGDTYIGGSFTYDVVPSTLVGSGGSMKTLAGDGQRASGAHDAAVARCGGLPAIVRTVVDDGSGGFFIGGIFSTVDGVARANLAHILPDGTLDPTWNPGTDAEVQALVRIGPDLYVGGEFTAVGGLPRVALAKVSTTGAGSVDAAWDPALTTGTAWALESEGSDLYAGGLFNNGLPDSGGLIKLDLGGTGARDMGWSPGNAAPIYALEINGSDIYAGGGFFTVGANPTARLAKIDLASGIVDPAWDPAPDMVPTELVSTGSSLIAAGAFSSIGGVTIDGVAKLDLAGTGAADPSWDPDPNGYDPVDALLWDGSDLYIGGDFHTIGGATHHDVVRIDPNDHTDIDADWKPVGAANRMNTNALSISGSNLYAGGMGMAGHPGDSISGLARLSPNGTVDTTWRPELSGVVYTLQLDGTQLYAGGVIASVRGSALSNLARIDITGNGSADATWTPASDGPVVTLRLHEGQLYAGGMFTSVGGLPRASLARLSPSGTGVVDPTWDPGTDGIVYALEHVGDAVFVGGNFAIAGGQPRANVAKLSSSGSGAADPDWDAAADGLVYRLERFGTDLFTTGLFTVIGGQARSSLAKIDAMDDGHADPAWAPDPDGFVTAIEVVGEDVYVGGPFANINGAARNGLARLSATGTAAVDPTWVPVLDTTVELIQRGGTNLYIGGSFTTLGGAPASFARFEIAIDSTPPTPNAMTAVGVADSASQITWNAAAATDNARLDAFTYSIDTGTPAWQPSRTRVSTALDANTQYTRTVRARDNDGNVSSGTVSTYTLPNAPTSPIAIANEWKLTGGASISLMWTAPAGGAASYNIRSSADGYASVVGTSAAVTTLLTGLDAATQYTYAICAVNAQGAEQPSCTTPVSATTAAAERTGTTPTTLRGTITVESGTDSTTVVRRLKPVSIKFAIQGLSVDAYDVSVDITVPTTLEDQQFTPSIGTVVPKPGRSGGTWNIPVLHAGTTASLVLTGKPSKVGVLTTKAAVTSNDGGAAPGVTTSVQVKNGATPRADQLDGTMRRDVIDALSGHDVVRARAGNDVVDGNAGDDQLFGDGGNDLLRGGSGADRLRGGAGHDGLRGGPGADRLHGGAGNDNLRGGLGTDLLSGDAGNDYLIAEGEGDTLYGGAGRDRVDGGSGDDVLNGGDDGDWLNGKTGDDVIRGDAGNDWLRGFSGADVLAGGTGDDLLNGGGGSDALHGGAGNDIIRADDGTGGDTVTCGEGWDIVYANEEDTVAASCEYVKYDVPNGTPYSRINLNPYG